jgi:hypothetical protein
MDCHNNYAAGGLSLRQARPICLIRDRDGVTNSSAIILQTNRIWFDWLLFFFSFVVAGELDWMPIINHDHQVRSTGGIISARRSGNGRTV